MDKKNFTYYHVVKNEDATPFCHLWEKGNGFIVAADGLGGSGSTVHRLSDDQYAKLAETLPGLVLPEYFHENVSVIVEAREEEAIRDMTPEGHIDVDRVAGLIADEVREKLAESEEHAVANEDTAKENAETVNQAPPAPPAKKDETPFDLWLKELLRHMIDDIPDTSALWGSRIAISRFAFYMLSNPDTDLSREDDRKKIIDFIYKGMAAVADYYSLSAGDISGQSVLPTTLVSMKFKTEADGQILVETVWAGDSRAYAFIPGQGMKQLSVDDEDESGAICNLFTMGRSNSPFATNLHYAAYRLPAKSAIFVCSDGVFDPYAPIDNIGVDAVFLEALQKATDFESLGSAWHELYSPMRHDDTSVAFQAFGFEDFDEFKACFLPAYDGVLKVYEDYHTGKKIYPIIMGEEEHPQIYVEERANKRMEQISRILAANLLTPNAPADVTVTPNLRRAYGILKRNQKCDEVRGFLCDGPSKAEEMFVYPDGNAADDHSQAIRTLIDGARSIMEATAMPKKIMKKLEEALREGDALAALIEQRKREIGQLALKCIEGNRIVEAVGNGLQDCYDPDSYEELFEKTVAPMQRFFTNRTTACKTVQESLETVLDHWKNKKSMVDLHPKTIEIRKKTTESNEEYLTIFQTDLHFFEDMKKLIDAYLELKDKADSYGAEYQQRQLEQYEKMVDDLDDVTLAAILSEPTVYLTETAQALFVADADIPLEQLTEALVCLFKEQPDYFSEVITALSTSAEPTILDGIFNSGRLKVARTFNSFDKDAVLENRLVVDAMVAAYEDVAAWVVG